MKRLRQAGYFRIADNPGVIACRFKFKLSSGISGLRPLSVLLKKAEISV
jgi:hypothetical protein